MKIFKTMLAIVRASYPQLWPYTGFLFLFGFLVAYKTGLGVFDAEVFWYLLWFTVFLNIFGMLINDHYDREIDKHNPRKAHVRTVSPTETAIGIGASFGAFAVIFFFFPNHLALLFAIVPVLVNVAYSVPPLRLKKIPPFDVLVGPGSYLPAALAGYSVAAHTAPSAAVVCAGILFFCGLDLAFKTLDIEADVRGGVRTSAVALGRARSVYISWVLLTLCASLLYLINPLYALAPLPHAAVMGLLLRTRSASELQLLDKKLPRYYALAGFFAACVFMSI